MWISTDVSFKRSPSLTIFTFHRFCGSHRVRGWVKIQPGSTYILRFSRSAWRSDQNCDYRLRPNGKREPRTKGPRGNHSERQQMLTGHYGKIVLFTSPLCMSTGYIYHKWKLLWSWGGVMGDYRTNPLQQLYWLKMLLTTHSWFVA